MQRERARGEGWRRGRSQADREIRDRIHDGGRDNEPRERGGGGSQAERKIRDKCEVVSASTAALVLNSCDNCHRTGNEEPAALFSVLIDLEH